MKQYKKLLIVITLVLVANISFGWWVFDARKEAAYSEWLKNKDAPAAAPNSTPAPAPTPQEKINVYLYTANDLDKVFGELSKSYTKQYPQINIVQTSQSNRVLLKSAVTAANLPDVLALSSETALKENYFPQQCDWYISFASNELVLLYTPGSQFASEINQANWREVLTREKIRYGYLDPKAEEVGSRTIFCWQLAEEYYQIKDLYLLLLKNVSQQDVFNAAADMLTALNKGELDYAFHYRTFALENNVKFVTLPQEINLGNPEMAARYQKTVFKIKDAATNSWISEKGGPIVNLITIPNNAPHKEAAMDFLTFCLEKGGAEIVRRGGLSPLAAKEAVVKRNLPVNLKKYVMATRQVEEVKDESAAAEENAKKKIPKPSAATPKSRMRDPK